MVGVMHMSRDLIFLRDKFEKKPINWVVGENIKKTKPPIIICISALHLTELKYFIQESKLNETEIVPLFCL